MEERIYLAFLHALGISQARFFDLFSKHQNYKEIFEMLSSSHLEKIGYNKSYITRVLNKRKTLNISDIQEKINSRNVKIIPHYDKTYPEVLKQIPNTPYFLYVRGEIDNSAKISVVGARKLTSYGDNVISKIVPDLSKYFQIVSGGALGADTLAHKACLQSSGKTICVLGTGIDIDYPVSNQKLYDEISHGNGAVISIFPIGEQGSKYSFPIRNEIVAGLSVGTVVIEAKERSGTLITANLSLDLGRDLFAVPGTIFNSNSQGCNNLIKTGAAKLVSQSEDILGEYNVSQKDQIQVHQEKIADKVEKNIYDVLLLEGLSSDEVSRKLDLDISTCIAKLSMMEIQGYIKKNIAGEYEVL